MKPLLKECRYETAVLRMIENRTKRRHCRQVADRMNAFEIEKRVSAIVCTGMIAAELNCKVSSIGCFVFDCAKEIIVVAIRQVAFVSDVAAANAGMKYKGRQRRSRAFIIEADIERLQNRISPHVSGIPYLYVVSAALLISIVN